MGDEKAVTKVLEQLVNLLATKKEDGAASEEGKQPNPRGEMQYRLELAPNESLSSRQMRSSWMG